VVLAGVAACLVHNAQAQSEVHALPLKLQAGKIILKESLFARQKGRTVYLPLRSLADALDFVIEVEPGNAYASGWFLSKDQRVSFDARAGEVVSEGKRMAVGSDAFLTDRLSGQGELYVARDALNRAWPVDLSIDRSALKVYVNPEDPLPVQRRKERQQRRERQLNRQDRDLDLRHVDHAYRRWSWPDIDLNAELDVQEGDGISAVQEVGLAGDLLGASADGRVVASRTPDTTRVTDARLTFRRADLVDPLPGPLKDVQAGDVSRRALTRIGGLGRGRGITLSSFPIERAEQFDTTTIEGNAPSNYEAELFRNGRLLRFQRTGDDGRYEFEDVALLFGNNRLRVVLYGPQGQTEERLRVINTSRALARPGQTIGRVSLVDVGTDLIPIGDQSNGNRSGLSLTSVFAHGLTKRTSAFAAATNLPTRAGTKQYAVGGINTAFGGTTAQVRALTSLDGGFGLDLQTLSRVGPVRVNVSGGVFNAFESPDVGFGESATRFDADLSTNTRLNLGVTKMNLGVDGQIQQDRSGRTDIDLNTTQRFAVADIRVNHGLDRGFGDNANDRFTGSLSTSTRVRPLRLRTGMTYNAPGGIQGGRMSVRYDPGPRLSLGVNLQQQFEPARSSVGLDLTRRFGPVLMSLTSQWREDDGASVGLRLNVGAAHTPGEGYEPVRAGTTSRGSVRANVFLDRDNDGERDADEPPVPNAKFGRAGRGRGTTDENGQATIHGMGTLDTKALTVRERSLDNPFWLPAHEGYALVPRPGATPRVDIPISETGAVDGTVRLKRTGEGIPGIPLRLVDQDGDTVAKADSAYGGFFAFDRLRYGSYTLRLGDTDTWKLVEPVELAIDHNAPVASRQTVEVHRVERDSE